MIAYIEKFPFPPTTNNLYSTVGKRRIKSGSYQRYCRTCEEWRLENLRRVSEARDIIARPGKLLVTYKFYIEREKLICQSAKLFGKHKKFDVSNRIKACEDVLFEMLGRDDSSVFAFTAVKIPASESYVDIEISEFES